jgi:ATP-binding cassette subfamily F protein 3
LAQAGLGAEDMEKKVRSLSGGERAKLALAVFECENGNFLILDEPTNHLDLPARESLESALKEFDGTVLFVSHDRYFIQALADKILELDNGKAVEFKGSYQEYNDFKTAQKALELKSATMGENAQKRTPAPTSQSTYRSKEERALDAKRKDRIKQIEAEITRLEEEDETINAELSTPEVAGNFALLTEKCNRLEEIKTRLDTLYEEYETLI